MKKKKQIRFTIKMFSMILNTEVREREKEKEIQFGRDYPNSQGPSVWDIQPTLLS